jgi:radical SAM protein with 4Fe4S-binding SPASM domain
MFPKDYIQALIEWGGVGDSGLVTLKNAAINVMEAKNQSHVLRSFPTKILVEITQKCNINCIMCNRPRNAGDINFSIIEKIKVIFPYLLYFLDFGYGEPLLAKETMFNLLAILKESNPLYQTRTQSTITTNGTLIDDKTARRIVASGLKNLTISFDGATKETYEAIRKGAKFNLVIENIERINKEKALQRTKYPILHFEFVAMKKNIEELPKLLELAFRLRIPHVKVDYLLVNKEELEKESLFYHQELAQRIFYISKRKAANLGIQLSFPKSFIEFGEIGVRGARDTEEAKEINEVKKIKSKNISCYEPWYSALISFDGKVYPCCYLHKIMGDLTNQSFRQIWNSKHYQELRKKVNSENPPKECKECPAKHRAFTTL